MTPTDYLLLEDAVLRLCLARIVREEDAQVYLKRIEIVKEEETPQLHPGLRWHLV